jgi:hypothetical protein
MEVKRLDQELMLFGRRAFMVLPKQQGRTSDEKVDV